MGLFHGQEVEGGYIPGAISRWLIPETSGNDFNRVGATDSKRPDPPFHGTVQHPWKWLMIYFLMRCYFGNFGALKSWTIHWFREYFGHRRISRERVSGSAEEFTARLKEEAMAHPEVEAVGIAPMRDEYYYDTFPTTDLPWVIMLARKMDYDKLSLNLTERNFDQALKEVIGGYERTQKAAVDLANWIRARGWQARGIGTLTFKPENMFLAIPPAMEAGLGQLGKHGSLISDELGSAFRMSCVLTDLPLIPDKPRDIGSEDFCASCQKCVNDCPPGAITNEKQLINGGMRWYVDFDKCAPYMTETKGCAICLSTCPYSRPGVAPKLTQKMLKRRERSVSQQARTTPA